ncbi:MAG TPA: hypothetical protein VNA14_09720 [Mycobacteriales bacterium]|nr:hypothetical protein [Mycobacteriales bacterium]
MKLPVRSIATRAVSTSFSLGTTVVKAGVGVARHVPVVSSVAGKAKDVATHGLTTAATQGMAVVAKVRGVPTQQEQAAAVESALDPFSLPEAVADLVEHAAPGATLAHAELPLEDYDHLTIGSLRARIRRLDAPALVQLRDYERAHGNRLPVLMAFDNRLKTLAAETPGAEQATLVTV